MTKVIEPQEKLIDREYLYRRWLNRLKAVSKLKPGEIVRRARLYSEQGRELPHV